MNARNDAAQEAEVNRNTASENSPLFLDGANSAFNAENKVKVTWTKFVSWAIVEDFPSEAVAKERFKEEEKIYTTKTKRKLTSMVAYRSAKSTIVSAVKHNISLTDDSGKPKGKTDVRSEINTAVGKPVKLDQFKASMVRAGKIADDLLTEDQFLTALNLAQEVCNKLKAELKTLVKQAA